MNEKNHRAKYETHLSISILLLIGFTAMLLLSIRKPPQTDTLWYFYAGLSTVLISLAAYFISTATVHKVKSDLLRKSRKKFNQEERNELD